MKKILSYVLIGTVAMLNGFMLFEGGLATAAETSTSVIGTPVSLEYPVELTVTAEMSLTCDTSTVNLGTISGMTGGTVSNSRDCIVKTSNFDGYTLSANASSDPAMVKVTSNTISFANYNGSTGSWDGVAATEAEFGYNATGDHTVSSSLWYALPTAPVVVSYSGVATDYNGVTTTMNYQAEAGANSYQPSGVYRANVTMTAVMN